MTRIGFSGPSGNMKKSLYDPDKDGLIALAQLVSAVCSETEAVAKVTFENLDAKGDVGTGAAQVAAGDHTHTLSDDVTGDAKTTITGTASAPFFRADVDVGAGADYDLASKILSFATVSRAVAVGIMAGLGKGADYFKLRLYMGGVQAAESAFIPTDWDIYSLVGIRALSGSQECKLAVHNYSGASETLRISPVATSSGSPVAAFIGIGSIKI